MPPTARVPPSAGAPSPPSTAVRIHPHDMSRPLFAVGRGEEQAMNARRREDTAAARWRIAGTRLLPGQGAV